MQIGEHKVDPSQMNARVWRQRMGSRWRQRQRGIKSQSKAALPVGRLQVWERKQMQVQLRVCQRRGGKLEAGKSRRRCIPLVRRHKAEAWKMPQSQARRGQDSKNAERSRPLIGLSLQYLLSTSSHAIIFGLRQPGTRGQSPCRRPRPSVVFPIPISPPSRVHS